MTQEDRNEFTTGLIVARYQLTRIESAGDEYSEVADALCILEETFDELEKVGAKYGLYVKGD